MGNWGDNHPGILEPQHIILLFFIIFGIPLAIWGYRAGAKRKIGAQFGMILGLVGILIVYCFDKIDKPKHHSLESVPDQLKKFKELLDSGAITEAEYNIQKAKILSS
jgi:hypothetical protein